jgi:hypothetical protein
VLWRKLRESGMDLLSNFSAVVLDRRTGKRRRDIRVELYLLTMTLLAK